MVTLYSLETRCAKRLIDDGQLGKVHYARSFGYRRRNRPFVDGYGTAYFVDKTISAGGALFDMGIYHIAQVLHLIGNPPVKTVTGATHRNWTCTKTAESSAGTTSRRWGSVGCGWKVGFHSISKRLGQRTMTAPESSKVLGRKGGVKLNPLTYFSGLSDMQMTSTRDLAAIDRRWNFVFPELKWYTEWQRHWVGALLGHVLLLPSAEYALNASLISEGIYMSSKIGREVTAEEIRKQSVSTAIDPYTPEKVWK